MSWSSISRVFLEPKTVEYSHDLMAKKKARVMRSPMILSVADDAICFVCLMRERLAAACLFVFGSLFL